MTNFLRLNHYSIGYISGTMFSIFLLIYLLSLKEKSKHTWLLVGYFFFTLLFNFGFVLRATIFTPEIAKPACFLIALYTCFANLVLISFIYSFPRNRYKKESYIVFFILILTGSFGYAYYILENLNSTIIYNFDTQLYEFQTPLSTAPMGILHFLTLLWILVVIIRKTIGEEREFRNEKIDTNNRFFCLLSPNARILRSFGWAVLLHTCFSGIYVLYATKNIPFAYFQFILTTATSLQLFIYTVIYLNNSPQPSSFMIKIVGLTLVSTLTILSIVSRITLQIYETYFDEVRNMEVKTILKNIRTLDKIGPPESVLYISSRPKDSGLFATSGFKIEYKTLDTIRENVLFQSEIQEIGKYLSQSPKRTSSTKETWKDHYEIDETSVFPISKRLYRSLKLANGKTILSIRYLIQNDDSVYEIAYPFSYYSEALHFIVFKMIALIFFTALLILLLFPYLFHGGLIRPLMALLSGVKEVNEGKYKVAVPVQAEDEIGFLSRSFNHMVESIHSTQEKLREFTESLEEKVVERTNELRQSLDVVQELKTKQDADYYLTSLLIQPLAQNKSDSDNVFVEFLTEQKKKFQFKRWSSEIGGDLCVSSKITLRGKSYTAILNGDAMGKSMQGAGGALVLGSVFKAILERSRYLDVMNLFPEHWLKNTFIELHNIFTSFDGTMLASGFISLLDDESGFLYYINAAHPLPVYYRSKVANFLPHRFFYRKLGMPINMQTSLHINTFQFRPEDVLIIGSDGRDDILIQENDEATMNEDEEFFLHCVERGNGILQNIIEEIKLAGEITDDISLIRVEYKLATDLEAIDLENSNKIYSQALQEFKRRNYENAISLLEPISEDPIYQQNKKVLKLLANTYVQKNEYRKAVDAALRYSNISPDDLDCLFLISKCYKNLDNLKRAADFGERIRLRNPEHKQNLIHLSEIYQNSGDSDRAKALIHEAKRYQSDESHNEG